MSTTTTTTISPATLPITTIPRGPITASLTYYSPPPDGSKPYNYVEPQPPGNQQRNYTSSLIPSLITDARGSEPTFSTDEQGFALLSSIRSAADFSTDETIEATYYPEVEALLLSQLKANKVILFDHTVRRATEGAKRAPVNRVHVDQTPSAAKERVHRHLPDEAEELLKGRVRIVNVWRPLNGPVVSSPLAMADSRSVTEKAMVAIEHRYPDRVGETAGVQHEDGHRWYYWSGMGDEERILLQCYDSERGRRVPHTAFVDPRTEGSEWRARESIEVRALVFG